MMDIEAQLAKQWRQFLEAMHNGDQEAAMKIWQSLCELHEKRSADELERSLREYVL